MSDHGTGNRSGLEAVAFLAKFVAIFSLFAVVGSLIGTGVPDTRALVALTASLAVVVGIGIVRDR